jgi:hypothetical protein
MSSEAPRNLDKKGLLHKDSMIFDIKNAGHHLYIDNPLECVASIFKFCLSEEENGSFLEENSEEIKNHTMKEAILHPHKG